LSRSILPGFVVGPDGGLDLDHLVKAQGFEALPGALSRSILPGFVAGLDGGLDVGPPVKAQGFEALPDDGPCI
jgi:hypothetical protein